MKMMRFEGATMRDAIAKVKAELGDQAVIISTREVRRGLLGTGVEISAAVEDDEGSSGHGPNLGGPLSGAVYDRARNQVERQQEVDKAVDPLRSEMKSLRAMVRASGSDQRGAAELRAEIAALRKLVENLTNAGPGSAQSQDAMAASSKSATPTGPLTAPSEGRVLMLVGPTGAGKTTTIAKLAATAALVHGQTVQLITLDTQRVGGIEQIAIYADLIGCPLSVAESPADLANAIDPDADLVLIDTAGSSPRDTAAIIALAAELGNLPALEVHLVAPAASSAASIDELANRFRPLQPSRLLFTKLDEVTTAPELMHAPARTQLPVTWVTTGQAVPEDIESPTRARLIELANTGLVSRSQAA